MVEAWMTGTAYVLYPEYAYLIPPNPTQRFLREEMRQERYIEDVRSWGEAWVVEESRPEEPVDEASSPIAALDTSSSTSILNSDAPALTDSSGSVDRYA